MWNKIKSLFKKKDNQYDGYLNLGKPVKYEHGSHKNHTHTNSNAGETLDYSGETGKSN